jgi:hypothetical protein
MQLRHGNISVAILPLSLLLLMSEDTKYFPALFSDTYSVAPGRKEDTGV